ncbi:MAG: T9SS type A sorting domain-containing protein [Bacteroidales bacterium]|nr:T9SS type A sorting domain-containing protein [Bacteroidales bacterium]
MRSLLKIFCLLTLIGLVPGINGNSQNYIEVGTGTVSNTMPIYSYWNYSWSSLIYSQSDLGTAKSITKIGLNCINGPKTVTNQKIYFKLSSASIFPAANYEDPTNNGYTLAFQGDLTFVSGWNEITLSTPIPYDGIQNLIFHWENRWGTSYGPAFYSTTSSTNNNKNCGNDQNFPPPTQTGYLNPYPGSLANMRFYYAGAGPATPTNPIPADNATTVSVGTTLSWTLGANTTNYDLYFGTDPNNLPMVVNNASAGAGVFSYTPPALLADSVKHYWKVVARNGSQQEISPVWKFKTEVVIDQFPYFEGFEDSLVFNTYPVVSAWVIDPDVTWYQYTVNPHSGNLCAKSSWYTYSTQAILRSPKVLLPPNHEISYYWQNTDLNKVAGHDTTYFEVTTNGGLTWIKVDTLSPASINNSYVHRTHNLTAYAGNNFFFRFRHKTDTSSSARNVYLDDISIYATVPVPSIQLNTTQLAFNELYVNGHTTKKLLVTNSGTVNLVINSIGMPSPFAGTYGGTLLPGETDTITVQFNGLTAGYYSGNLVFNIQGTYTGSNTVLLSGNVLSDLASLDEPFDASLQIPSHWNTISSITDPNHKVLVVADAMAHSTPNDARMSNNNDLVSPLIFITPGVTGFADHELSFYARKDAAIASMELQVGLMDDPYDASSFELVQSISLTDQIVEYTVAFSASNLKPYLSFRLSSASVQSNLWIDNVLWNNPVVPPAPPAPGLCIYPANNAVDVDIMMASKYLIWAAGSQNTEGYKISLGTNNPPSNIINNANLGDTVVYQIPTLLNYNTTYYWQIVPYNTVGQALNCPVWSFTTMQDPTISQFPFSENFDALTPGSAFTYLPFLPGYVFPLGWSVVSPGQLSSSWNALGSNASSGPNAMAVGPATLSSLDEWLFSSPISMTAGLHYKLDFKYRMIAGSGTTSEKLEVRVGNSNTPMAMNIAQVYDNQNIVNTSHEPASGVYTPVLSGIYFFGFHAYSAPSQGELLIDDIEIKEINTTGLPAKIPSGDLYIYPNPSKGILNLKASGSNSESCTGEVLDLSGRRVMLFDWNGREERLDLSSLSKGTYLVRLIYGDQQLSRIIVLQ